MDRIKFKNEVISYLKKYNFKYDKAISKKNKFGEIDVWIYYTTKLGNKDYFLVNSFFSTDKNNSIESCIKQLSILEGFIS